MSSTLEERTTIDPITGLKADPEFSDVTMRGIYLTSFTIGMATRFYEATINPVCELFLMGGVPALGGLIFSQLYKNPEEKHGKIGYKRAVAYIGAIEAAGYLLVDLAIR